MSICTCFATFLPNSMTTSCSASSSPAEMPAPVTRVPRASGSGLGGSMTKRGQRRFLPPTGSTWGKASKQGMN
ncbi:MAG TPA: hypothetical protein VFY65_18330, partial [Longimicrobium sp.]|nr:hypothetical protein [Longimicrobium sp.]